MSETVIRWDHHHRGMTGYPDGEYVRYTDYAALAQQLADVAYLEAWVDAGLQRGVDQYRPVGGGVPRWYAEDGRTVAEADSLPALGALLRQREVGR